MARPRNRVLRQIQARPRLLIATAVALAVGALAVSREIHGILRGAHIALAGCTVLSSWAFIQVMFALRTICAADHLRG